jgi:hypothetical protein
LCMRMLSRHIYAPSMNIKTRMIYLG